jgi:hypothetical protein
MTTVSLEKPSQVFDPMERIPPKPAVSTAYAQAVEFAKTLLGGVTGAASSAATGVTGDYANLIGLQMQMQKEMMEVSMVSNVLKSKHEAQMAPVRNIRVG